MKISRNVISIGVAASLLLAAVVVYATSDSSCQNAWSQSAASSSCSGGQGSSTSAYVEWRAARQECVVTAYCTTGSAANSTQYNQVYGSTSEVRELKNCSGTLKADCSE